ncbi:leucyl aminopeptidase [Facilibium subflavum]|uniref:leucyl aminopeptidase n=1 Tax=Facilibium subflavum TaxID=2219058 RepID=UPI000E652309|nr:leucyl aminopeptidase [Facilibium subflavum]
MKISAVKQLNNSSAQIIFLFEGEKSNITSIQKSLDNGFFKAKLSEVLPVTTDAHCYIAAGLGKQDKLTITGIRKTINAVFNQLKSLNITKVAVNAEKLGENATRVFVEALVNAAYKFDQLKEEKQTYVLEHVEIQSNHVEEAQKQIHLAQCIAQGQNYAKDLKNLPANICDTDYMLNEAKKLAQQNDKLNLHYLTEDDMHKLGMGCITAVGRGSSMPSYIACMEYFGGQKDQKPLVLVGKGMVYDTGGLCLKPWQGMGTMKMDMGGAAAVYGVMKAITDLKLPVNVIGAVALVENSIDGKSYRPGDVLKSMQGLSVEIGNTDAEGRLALCDTLTYIEKYNPEVVIDIATLTGAMVVSLGGGISGLFGNDDALVESLKTAAQKANDPAWHLPLFQDYHEMLKSEIADMNNIGGSAAGSITAALFLSRFTEKYRWAHLDTAGSAMGTFEKANATGRPVPLLVQYILDQIK